MGRDEVRVAMAIQRFAPAIGGGELQLERLLPHLADRGVRARVLTRAAGAPTPCFVADGVRIHRTAAKGESAFASLVYVGGSSVNVLAQRARTDLVHAQTERCRPPRSRWRRLRSGSRVS